MSGSSPSTRERRSAGGDPGESTKHVRLSLTANGREDEVHPMYDLMANSPIVSDARTTHWTFTGDRVVMMHYVEGDADAFRVAVDRIDEVATHEVTAVDAESFYAYVSCRVTNETVRELFETLADAPLVVSRPIYRDGEGTAVLSIVGDAEAIQAAIDGIPEPIDVGIREIGGFARAGGPESRLSDGQRETAERALELGYYEVPRRATLEDVAEDIGRAKSTAWEHLRKTEAKVVRSVLRD